MASSQYCHKLNPYRQQPESLVVKGIRQSVVITNNPSTIDQIQQLLIRFPNLDDHYVVILGTARLAFTITLESADANKNLGRAIVKKTTIKVSGNEVMSIDGSDVECCYNVLWKTAKDSENAHYQGMEAGFTCH